MPRVKKTVRFYDTLIVDENDSRKTVNSSFWDDLFQHLSGSALADRTANIRGTEYFGHTRTPHQPATTHLQVERIRSQSEQLNQSNLSNGQVLPLNFSDPNDRVTEPTYVVPFGSKSRVAVLSPAARGTRYETISRWLTQVLRLPERGMTLLLVPVIDPGMLERISDADGAVMLEVSLGPDAPIPTQGGGDVGAAFRSAQQDALETANLTFRWSLGRSGGTVKAREALLEGALWIARQGVGRKAKVKLIDESPDGKILRDEMRDIVADRISKQISFEVYEDNRLQESEIVAAINGAIAEFRSDGEELGFHDLTEAPPIVFDISAGRAGVYR